MEKRFLTSLVCAQAAIFGFQIFAQGTPDNSVSISRTAFSAWQHGETQPESDAIGVDLRGLASEMLQAQIEAGVGEHLAAKSITLVDGDGQPVAWMQGFSGHAQLMTFDSRGEVVLSMLSGPSGDFSQRVYNGEKQSFSIVSGPELEGGTLLLLTGPSGTSQIGAGVTAAGAFASAQSPLRIDPAQIASIGLVVGGSDLYPPASGVLALEKDGRSEVVGHRAISSWPEILEKVMALKSDDAETPD